ncbi:MAG: polyprenyl synthetase family protein [Prevotella sp.]|mgnify:FL=1|nr:polyprenyl synthetase family protein [Prevotellaceae bacterium]MDY4890629.1 polyprenyl synthetase family protein [Prevotella sp.]MDY5249259.1 polyprenyl synthetase family protein [Prevotella sp.]
MDQLSIIKRPIKADLERFVNLFEKSLTHDYGLLAQVLDHIRQRAGKRMRPMLILLMAKHFGGITDATQYAAVGLELLHTASLVHDDVVDDSAERRGQSSVNAEYNNKVAVLVGDYILSTALLNVALTDNQIIVKRLAELGRTLASGEILQLSNIQNTEISEDVYYDVIIQKTAALFEACCTIGALSAGGSDEDIEKASLFGRNLGIMFQIKDDIFDYSQSSEIGKPTGNDMAEGKLTLPVIYALNSTGNVNMRALAMKVKDRTVTPDEITMLVDFTKKNGGIEYAEKRMNDFSVLCKDYVAQHVVDQEVRDSLYAYIDYIVNRNK